MINKKDLIYLSKEDLEAVLGVLLHKLYGQVDVTKTEIEDFKKFYEVYQGNMSDLIYRFTVMAKGTSEKLFETMD